MRTLTLAALLPLFACSQQPAQPTARPTPSPAPTGAIPASLQGRWAIAPADCDPNGDVRGLLTIGPDAFAFGATPITVDRVIARPDEVAFDTTETDEGVAASRRYRFALSPDGRQLTRADGKPANQVYTRCPDRPS